MSSNHEGSRRRVRLNPPKNEKISLYVYDKYAAKYTADQLDLILRRSKASGQQSALAIWILLIIFAIFVDFLGINSYVTSQDTYRIEATIDGGLVSNFYTSKFGWPIVLLLVASLWALLFEGITSDNFLLVAVASATLLLIEISTIITCLALNTTSSYEIPGERTSLRWDLFGSLNLAVGCTVCLAWIIWHSIELILLLHTTKRIQHTIDLNQDKTLLSRQRLRVASKPRRSTSSSRRHRKLHAAATAAQPQPLKTIKSKDSQVRRTQSKSKKSLFKSAPMLGTSSKISKSRTTLSKKSVGSKISGMSEGNASKASGGREVPSSKISLNLIQPSKKSVFIKDKQDDNR